MSSSISGQRAKDFFTGLGVFSIRLGVLLLIGLLSYALASYFYPSSPWAFGHAKYEETRKQGIKNREATTTQETHVPESSADANKLLAEHTRLLNRLLDLHKEDSEAKYNNTVPERKLVFCLLILFSSMSFYKIFAYIGARSRRAGHISPNLSVIWVNHPGEIWAAILVTVFVLALSLYLYDIRNLELRSESFATSGLPFAVFGTLASVLGCLSHLLYTGR